MGKDNREADGDWENCVKSQGAYFEGDWSIIILCTVFLVSCIFLNKSLFFILHGWIPSGQTIHTHTHTLYVMYIYIHYIHTLYILYNTYMLYILYIMYIHIYTLYNADYIMCVCIKWYTWNIVYIPCGIYSICYT